MDNVPRQAVSKTSNAALIPAILEVNSNEFDATDPSDIVREFDADGDNVPDQLICKYWERWGSTVCEVESSKYGLINSHIGCKRAGVALEITRSGGLVSISSFEYENFGRLIDTEALKESCQEVVSDDEVLSFTCDTHDVHWTKSPSKVGSFQLELCEPSYCVTVK